LIHALGLRSQDKNKKALSFLKNAIKEDPLNAQARFAIIEYYITRLAADTVPKGIEIIANSLQGTAMAVVQGWKFSVNGDYTSLAQLELQLKKAEATDLWYHRALQLRAEWRIMLSAAHNNDQNLYEALDLIDRALVLQPKAKLYTLRTRCAGLLGEPEIFIESMRYLVSSIDSKLIRTKENGEELSRDYLVTLQTNLEELNSQMNADFLKPFEQRAKVIESDLDALLKKIEKEFNI